MFFYGLVPGLLAGFVWMLFSTRIELYPRINLGKADKLILSVLGFFAFTLIFGPISMYIFSYKFIKSGDMAYLSHLLVLGIPLIVLQLLNLDESSRNRINQLLFTGLIVLIFGVITPLMYNIFLNH